jgi:uncharacterized protein (DUF2336 family)
MPAPSLAKPTVTSMRDQAKALLELARDPSPEARTALVSGVYDLCHESADLPAADRALGVEVVLAILKRAEASVRRQVAERLARDPNAPKILVIALASDEDVSVAYPVLIDSLVLDESDLVEILRKSPPEHRLGTLQRESLSEAVASVAVETGDPQVMRWLVANPGASISRSDMEVIVQAARVEPELQKPLASRTDLPADLATEVRSFVSDELREVIDRNNALTAAPTPGVTAAPNPRRTDQDAALAAAEADRRALALALDHRKAGTLTVEMLFQTIRAGKMVEFEAFLARYGQISLSAARQILASPSGEALAVVLKSPGVNKGAFAKIFLLNCQARDASTEVHVALARAGDAFDRLQTADAAKHLAALRTAHPEDPAY